MKKLSLSLLILTAASLAFMTNTGCSGGGGPLPQDSTDNKDTTPAGPANGFTIGFDSYDLDVVQATTYGVYNNAANKTYIFIQGNDGTQAQNEQNADLALEVDSNVVGSYTKNQGARIDLGTGTGIKRLEYTSDGASITIVITEYGPVGGRIKGTFSGSLKASGQVSTTPLKDGFFDVERIDDE